MKDPPLCVRAGCGRVQGGGRGGGVGWQGVGLQTWATQRRKEFKVLCTEATPQASPMICHEVERCVWSPVSGGEKHSSTFLISWTRGIQQNAVLRKAV